MACKEILIKDNYNLISLKNDNKRKICYLEHLIEEMNLLKKNMKSIEKIKKEISAHIIKNNEIYMKEYFLPWNKFQIKPFIITLFKLFIILYQKFLFI